MEDAPGTDLVPTPDAEIVPVDPVHAKRRGRGRPRGRPKIRVSIRMLRSLANIHCTYEEMARILNIGVSTLERNYGNLVNEERAKGTMSLRRAQFKSAKKGSVTAQIWLGKQLLGQKDKVEHTGPGGSPLQIAPRLVVVFPESIASDRPAAAEHGSTAGEPVGVDSVVSTQEPGPA